MRPEKRTGPTKQSEWEDRYREESVEDMPWYYPHLDPDIKTALDEMNITSGSFLDLCTGPGTQAMALAKMGFVVTGTDISATAVERAKRIAREQGLDIRFIQNDILNSTLEETFDYIFDRGCFHTFEPEMRNDHVEMVHTVLKPGGVLFLKCFSHLEESDRGPHKISPDQIREYFLPEFALISITDTNFQGGRDPKPKALFCVLRKE